MNPRVKLLKELVGDDLYVIDPAAVADALLLRSMTRHMVPEVTFRGTVCPEPEAGSCSPASSREVVSLQATPSIVVPLAASPASALRKRFRGKARK